MRLRFAIGSQRTVDSSDRAVNVLASQFRGLSGTETAAMTLAELTGQRFVLGLGTAPLHGTGTGTGSPTTGP